MSEQPFCLLHEQFAKDVRQLLDTALLNTTHIEEMTKQFKELKCCMTDHVLEAEKEGGIRDRLKTLETTVSTLKKSYWKTSIVAAFIGALLGHITPDFFRLLQFFIGKHILP